MSSFISYLLKQLFLGKKGKTSKRGNIKRYSITYLTRDNPKRQNLTSFGELRNMIMGRRQPVSTFSIPSSSGPRGAAQHQIELKTTLEAEGEHRIT